MELIVITLGEIARQSYFRNKHGMLLRGETLEEMSKLPDKSVHMILADLPYGTTQNKWDSIVPLDRMWEQYERIIMDNGAIVLTAQPPFDKVLGVSNLKLLKYEWIWEKNKATGHLNAKKMPMKAHENVLIFYKNLPTYNPQGLTRKEKPTVRKGGGGNGTNYGKSDKDAIQEFENYPRDILQFDMDTKTVHPTQKPVALFEYFIRTYTNEGEIVLDNTSGSGTTAVAAEMNNRKWICIEKDVDEKGNVLGYCDATVDRLKKIHNSEAS